MSINVEVSLLSGKRAAVNVGLDEDVARLMFRAQSALEVKTGKLLDSSGNFLDGRVLIKDTMLEK